LARNAGCACHAFAVNLSRLWSIAAFVALGVGCLILGGWLRTVYSPEWMSPDTMQQPPGLRPWAVEADCYSQLARVQRILQGQGLIQNHFTVENWPEGLVPSTTAPFDYVILLLYAPLSLFTRHPLDWAGALVSPALWAGLVVFWMLFRSREFNLAGRALLLAGSAALPAFIWATACGRPRHQSLILALMAMGLTSEYERWQIELTPKRAWNIFAGIVWGLACWTSLFEPAVVVIVLVLFNLIVRRKENPAFLASLGIVVLAMMVLEGGHIFSNIFNITSLTPEYRRYALNWLSTIAEVRPVDFAGMMQRMTLILLALPFLASVLAWRLWTRANGNRTDALLIFLTLLLTVLTTLQSRWVYYASLGELFLVVRYYQIAPAHWTRLTVLFIFLIGLADADYEQIKGHAGAPPNQPSLQLAEISRAIDQPGGIMAPWWLSPGLLYFSGQPIVSGSSHCGISGIVASAKFYSATSWAEAERILQKRRVRWVVVFDDPIYEYPLLNTSLGILGLPEVSDDDKGDADSTVAQLLISDQYLPTAFHLRGVTAQLKLYEYEPDEGN
jgi:hypothetical protein